MLELKQILGDAPPAVAAHYYKKMHPTSPVMKSVRVVIDEMLKAKRGTG